MTFPRGPDSRDVGGQAKYDPVRLPLYYGRLPQRSNQKTRGPIDQRSSICRPGFQSRAPDAHINSAGRPSFSQPACAQKAAMGEASGTTGGYLVSRDFYQQLLAISAESNLFRKLAFVQPMASATLQFPYLDITTVQCRPASRPSSPAAAKVRRRATTNSGGVGSAPQG
jgi:HK97 family phage major capsid protein